MSNIRSVLLAVREEGTHRVDCEAFRTLLPNLRGKRPDRGNAWLRACMRSILVSKMREDVVLQGIRGEQTRFPHHVYAWFDSDDVANGVAANNIALLDADENRWGFYYGVRALSKATDSECMLFWSLMDETHFQDGLQFVLHCMSTAFAMGGTPLWSQVGPAADAQYGIKGVSNMIIENTRSYVWMSLRSALDATKAIMSKSSPPQLAATLSTIDIMKESPPADDLFDLAEDSIDDRKAKKSSKGPAKNRDGREEGAKEPTHINFFMWLRVMLRQFQEDQNTRIASIRLMFEASSVGALTPLLYEDQSRGRNVEFPQFQAICQALFPSITTVEIAGLFSRCYDEGNKKVNATVFTKVADLSRHFSRMLHLEVSPLITPEDYLPSLKSREAVHNHRMSIDTDLATLSDTMISSIRPFQDELAIKINSLVHRKLTTLIPELRRTSRSVSQRWRQLLLLAEERVHIALDESLERITRRQRAAQSDGVKVFDLQVHCVDGLQPFLEYKRLLVLLLLVQSLHENPLLPQEVFTMREMQNNRPNLNRAEALVAHLEDALFVCGGESSKIKKDFEKARRGILARRLQNVYRWHRKKSIEVLNAQKLGV